MANVTSKFDLQRLMPADGFRLFSLQRDLFDFIDANSARTRWMPMCVEIPALAYKRDRDDPDAPAIPAQSRFFAAFTQEGVYRYLSVIPAAQQHLYEVVREGSRSRMYFDLEREVDFKLPARSEYSEEYDRAFGEQLRAAPAICPRYCTSLPNNHPDTVLGELFYRLVQFLQDECRDLGMHEDLLTRASQRLMLRYGVGAGIGDASPLRPEEVMREAGALLREQSICLQSVPLCKLAEGAVDRWAHPFEPTEGKFSLHVIVRLYKGDSEILFPSNVHVGSVVNRFVTYLYAQLASLRAAELRSEYEGLEELSTLHSALMFHGVASPGFPVVQFTTRDGVPGTGKLTPLLCVIDTSVYSRNRVFRCLGSSKLGKTNILVSMHKGRSYMDRWFDTLICPWIALPPLDDNEEGRGEDIWSSHVRMGESAVEDCELRCPFQSSTILDGLPDIPAHHRNVSALRPLRSSQQYSRGSQQEISEALEALIISVICPPNQLGTSAASIGPISVVNAVLTFSIKGSRYCHKVGREHKSNGVFVCLNLDSSICFQRCFDPECNKSYDGSIRRYRSPSVHVPDALLVEAQRIASALMSGSDAPPAT